MMYQETNEKIVFFFLDFGSSHKMGSSSNLISTFSFGFSSPEQNPFSSNFSVSKQSFKSDIFSLSKSFSSILVSSKIQISQDVRILLSQMSLDDIESRFDVDQCIEYLSPNYNKECEQTEQTNKFQICKNFDKISLFFKEYHQKQSNIHENQQISNSSSDKETIIENNRFRNIRIESENNIFEEDNNGILSKIIEQEKEINFWKEVSKEKDLNLREKEEEIEKLMKEIEELKKK